jgi:hypothetical protein
MEPSEIFILFWISFPIMPSGIVWYVRPRLQGWKGSFLLLILADARVVQELEEASEIILNPVIEKGLEQKQAALNYLIWIRRLLRASENGILEKFDEIIDTGLSVLNLPQTPKFLFGKNSRT